MKEPLRHSGHGETLRNFKVKNLVSLSDLSALVVKTERKMTQTEINQIAYKIVGAAIEVHKHLGPGLLESVYHSSLKDELFELGFKVQSQLWVPIHYKGKELGGQLKLDLLVENVVIVELKAVEIMIPLYTAQLLSYLKLASKPKGLLINFHSENITKQLVPLVTEEFSNLPK